MFDHHLFCFLNCKNHQVLGTHISQLQKENYTTYISYIHHKGRSEKQTAKFVAIIQINESHIASLQDSALKLEKSSTERYFVQFYFSFPDSRRNLGICQVEVLRCG